MQTVSQIHVTCQSCAMPISNARELGTEADGSASGEYCVHCRKDGAFTLQDITMREMGELCVDRMVERRIMPRAQATKMLRRAMPALKRWAMQPGARA